MENPKRGELAAAIDTTQAELQSLRDEATAKQAELDSLLQQLNRTPETLEGEE